MPRKLWTKKDERKYEKILESCKLERSRGKKRTVATCKRIAAATVNRDRKARFGGGPQKRGEWSKMSPREQTEWMALDLKAAKFFDSLTSYGDSVEDRQAAFRLTQERYPGADFRRLIAGYGLDGRKAGLRGLGAIGPGDAAAAAAEFRAQMLEASAAGADSWAIARAQRAEAKADHDASSAWQTLMDYTNAVAHYREAALRASMLGEPIATDMHMVTAKVKWEAADFAEWLALSLSTCLHACPED